MRLGTKKRKQPRQKYKQVYVKVMTPKIHHFKSEKLQTKIFTEKIEKITFVFM